MLPYIWKIDVDCIADRGSPEGTNTNAVKLTGPRDCNASLMTDPTAVCKYFQMLDDDGEVVYKGRLWCPEEYDGSIVLFAPLDEFGTPNAGCVDIKYKEGDRWTLL